MDQSKFKSVNDRIVTSFEEFKNNEDYWKTIDEIAESTDISEGEILDAIDNSGLFVENSNNEYTTLELYKNKTPFITKLLNSFKNSID